MDKDNDNQPPLAEEPPNGFLTTLQKTRNGAALAEASELLTELLLAVEETHKAGQLTCKITVKPNDDRRTVLVAIENTVKKPVAKIPPATFWLGEDGQLQTSDPQQPDLPLREVQRPPVREATQKQA